MSSQITLPKYVLEAARLWRQGYESLRELHNQRAAGKRIAVAFSDLLDETISAIYRGCLETEKNHAEIDQKITLVMHGGCGRREVSPHSDVDLLLLCHDENDPAVETLAKLLSQGITERRISTRIFRCSRRGPLAALRLRNQRPLLRSSTPFSRGKCRVVRQFSAAINPSGDSKKQRDYASDFSGSRGRAGPVR